MDGKILLFLTISVIQIIQINGHGRLLEPAARTSAWRKWPNLFPAVYDDNQMFCGGVDTQHNQNGGKCGICGENWSGYKAFEKGGHNYRNLLVANYREGQTIRVTVEITANHYGYFVFGLCNVDGQNTEATQACLDRTTLQDLRGHKQIYIERGKTGMMNFDLRLPRGFTCNHCVFQWKYNSGNSWGVDKVTGESGLGKGPQEQFYGCADVQIRKSKREFVREEKLENNEVTSTVENVASENVVAENSVVENLNSEVVSAEPVENIRDKDVHLIEKLIQYHLKRLTELLSSRSQLVDNELKSI